MKRCEVMVVSCPEQSFFRDEIGKVWPLAGPVEVFDLLDEPLMLGRYSGEAQAWVINLSPYVMSITYWKGRSDERVQVGPMGDLLMPQTVREVGMGPGVVWQLRRAG